LKSAALLESFIGYDHSEMQILNLGPKLS